MSLVILALFSLSLSMEAYTASEKGEYNVRGAGNLSCKVYEQEREKRSPAYFVTAGWVEGYITATSRNSLDTYDITSFESTELIMELISKHCQKHAGDKVFYVLGYLLTGLYEDRLTVPSEKKRITVGEHSTALYQETMRRIQARLKEKGYYSGKLDGDFGPMSAKAIAEFQRSLGFKGTGFPDQATLWKLMRTPGSK